MNTPNKLTVARMIPGFLSAFSNRFKRDGWTELLMRISIPFVSISIVYELSRYIELSMGFGSSSSGEFSGSIAIRTTSCLRDVRSRVLTFLIGSGIWQACFRNLVTAL